MSGDSGSEDADDELREWLRKALGGASETQIDHLSTGVLASGKFITDNAIDVAISPAGTKAAASQVYSLMQERQYSTHSWSLHALHPKPDGGAATVDFIFAMDLLNFSFWSKRSEEDRFAIEYRGKPWTGYWGLVAGLRRALEEDIPITTPPFWQQLTDVQLQHIFRSSTSEEMPMLQERLACLQEAGQVLSDKYDASFVNCLKAANHSAVSLVNILAREFPCLRDERRFHGEKVRIFKRAQIIVADVWACFNGQGHGEFHDIDSLTMFADYRIPQALNGLGVLLYSPLLAGRIRRGEELESGEDSELEIRGCSIWAVEMLKRVMLDTHPENSSHINSILIDTFLYDLVKEKESTGDMGDMLPHHRTRSIWY